MGDDIVNPLPDDKILVLSKLKASADDNFSVAQMTSTEQKKQEEKEKQKFEKDLKEMFDLFDKDKDKSISVDEMGRVLRSLGFRMTNKEIRQAVKEIDTNKNGKIEFGEFRSFMIKQNKLSKKDPDEAREIRQAFRVFDRDGNGYIDKKELKRAMTSLGESLTDSELQMMMREADENEDGKIDYEEFVRLWIKKTKAE